VSKEDGDAPSAPSWSSITSGPTRWEVRRPPRTSRFAAGATINMRPSWSLVLAPGASRVTPDDRVVGGRARTGGLLMAVAPSRETRYVDCATEIRSTRLTHRGCGQVGCHLRAPSSVT
jgi:hypothetical protein